MGRSRRVVPAPDEGIELRIKHTIGKAVAHEGPSVPPPSTSEARGGAEVSTRAEVEQTQRAGNMPGTCQRPARVRSGSPGARRVCFSPCKGGGGALTSP